MKRSILNLTAILVIAVGASSAMARPAVGHLLNNDCSSDDGSSSCSCDGKCTKTTHGCSCS